MKKITKRNFIFFACIAVVLLFFTVFSFNIPTTTKTFKGFANSINLGFDFGNGTRATYTVTNSDYSKYSEGQFVDKAVEIIESLATQKYTEAKVYRVGDDKINIEVPDETIPADLAIGQLEIKTQATEEAEVKLTGGHIKNAKYQMSGTNYGILIEFTSEGTQLLADMTSAATEESSVSIVFCLNKDYTNALTVSTTSAVEDGYVYFTMGTKDAAQLYANRIDNSRFGINLEQAGDAVTIYSNVSTFGKVVVATIACLLVVGSFVYLIIKYKDMGWICSLALMFFALFNIITFSLIPSFILTISSYIGMLLGYILTFFAIAILMERIKAEFESGKKLGASFKSGYLKALSTNIDIFAIATIISILCLITTTGSVFSFAFALLITCLFGALISLAVMLWFSRMYLKINNYNGSKLNFNKEVKNNGKEA